MHARIVSFREVPIALRVRCQTTREQNRMMYLSRRPAWEQQLARDWRIFRSVCENCGVRAGDHCIWCQYADL